MNTTPNRPNGGNSFRAADLARVERLEQVTARYVVELDWALRSARRLEEAGLEAGADLRAHLEAAVTHGTGTPHSLHLGAVRVLRQIRDQQGGSSQPATTLDDRPDIEQAAGEASEPTPHIETGRPDVDGHADGHADKLAERVAMLEQLVRIHLEVVPTDWLLNELANRTDLGEERGR